MFVLHGEFDPATGARLRSAIDTETNRLFHADGGRDAASGKRTPEQRRADAITALLTAPEASADGCADTRRIAPVRNQMLLIATLRNGEITDGQLADGSPLPAAVIERLACGSDLFALILSADGDPLWLGRKTRLATDSQWRALIARDKGCQICDAHPSKCEAHHIVAWQPPSRGPNNIDNLILLCSHHHHLVHDLNHRLVATTQDGWYLQPP